MQHLPSVPLVFRLFFQKVHQTNIPAKASAATDPNTTPTIINTVPTKRNKLEINFSKRKRIFLRQAIWSNFSCIVSFFTKEPLFNEFVIKGCGGHLVANENTSLIRDS